ncbi:MAG: ImmA/IrrE family metallo-endopeptidase [Chloroflexi bacterium]|nr:ImmA/IrrE family metallo-endopeptidase [Chloroflexota bacterium]MCL5109427.1 ImmA/IrrE family metallo-endopeptidase [Chloroflexota bacterium]
MAGRGEGGLYRERAARDKAELEALASRLLRQGGVGAPPVPANLVAFCDPSRPVYIFRRRLGWGHRGVVKPSRHGWLILVEESLSRSAQRFSIFHEAFHVLQRAQGILPHGGADYQEWLANAFAARVLMPGPWLEEALRQTADVDVLAYRFRVGRAAIEARLRELTRDGG